VTDTHGRRIVAVVVTYNRLEMLQRQLERLAEVPELDEVLVVDNASADGTGEWLRGRPVESVTLPENTGGAGGFSHGLERAVEMAGRPGPDPVVLPDPAARRHPGGPRDGRGREGSR
jgi:rhamnopyranosyl-N-acetylglucosaminyl-diphospho-decaprenol beta-1,3/1,4-galactofuranosyltransferase